MNKLSETLSKIKSLWKESSREDKNKIVAAALVVVAIVIIWVRFGDLLLSDERKRLSLLPPSKLSDGLLKEHRHTIKTETIVRDPFSRARGARTYSKEFKLEMIVGGKDEAFAIINNKKVTVGDFTGRYKVKKIFKDRVVLTDRNNQETTLYLFSNE